MKPRSLDITLRLWELMKGLYGVGGSSPGILERCIGRRSSSLDQHGVIETRGVDSWAPCRDAEGGRDWSQRQSEGWIGDGE